jgi:hypothetical protein
VEENKSTAWIEGAAILISVVIVVMVTAVNNLQKERQFQELQKKQVRSVRENISRESLCVSFVFNWANSLCQEEEKLISVFRDGLQQRLNIAELVVRCWLLPSPGSICFACQACHFSLRCFHLSP